jgi:hypothetical protein
MSGAEADGQKVPLARGPKGAHVRATEPQAVLHATEAGSSSREGHRPVREVDSLSSNRALLREPEKELSLPASGVQHPTSLGRSAEVDDPVKGRGAQRVENVPVPERDLGEFLRVHAEFEPVSPLAVSPTAG